MPILLNVQEMPARKMGTYGHMQQKMIKFYVILLPWLIFIYQESVKNLKRQINSKE